MSGSNARILMIEDDPGVSALNTKFLERRGMEVFSAATLALARDWLASNSADLILLDIMLPDGNGLEFMQELRQKSCVPVLMLTSKSSGQDIFAGLMGGGDDYMTKPYKLTELYARILALLRRAQMPRTESVKMPEAIIRGPLVLDVVKHQVFLGGADLMLTPKEYALLLILVRHEGEALLPEELYKEVWQQPIVGDKNAVRTALSRLRKKLEGSGYSIIAARGEGYKFFKEE